jgi:hypothetical protein
MDMIERVGRAIEKAAGLHEGWGTEVLGRAAIEAMRVPTFDMVQRAAEITDRPASTVDLVWVTMIDAALRER